MGSAKKASTNVDSDSLWPNFKALAVSNNNT